MFSLPPVTARYDCTLLLAAHTVFVGGIGDATEDDLYEFFSSNDVEPSDARVIGSKGLAEYMGIAGLAGSFTHIELTL